MHVFLAILWLSHPMLGHLQASATFFPSFGKSQTAPACPHIWTAFSVSLVSDTLVGGCLPDCTSIQTLISRSSFILHGQPLHSTSVPKTHPDLLARWIYSTFTLLSYFMPSSFFPTLLGSDTLSQDTSQMIPLLLCPQLLALG